jgi:hypothetical protein
VRAVRPNAAAKNSFFDIRCSPFPGIMLDRLSLWKASDVPSEHEQMSLAVSHSFFSCLGGLSFSGGIPDSGFSARTAGRCSGRPAGRATGGFSGRAAGGLSSRMTGRVSDCACAITADPWAAGCVAPIARTTTPERAAASDAIDRDAIVSSPFLKPLWHIRKWRKHCRTRMVIENFSQHRRDRGLKRGPA